MPFEKFGISQSEIAKTNLLEILITFVTSCANSSILRGMSVYGTDWGLMPIRSCFLPPVFPVISRKPFKAVLRSWPRLWRGTTFSFLQHFTFLNYCWSFLHSFFFSLSLGRSLTNAFFPLCFLPWHAEEIKATDKDPLLTCLWVFLIIITCLSYSKSNY